MYAAAIAKMVPDLDGKAFSVFLNEPAIAARRARGSRGTHFDPSVVIALERVKAKVALLRQ